MNQSLLRYSLLFGVFLFCAMAIAHFFGLKYPLLFVYFDTPFYAYQDKIIAFTLVTYACFFHSAIRAPQIMPAVLLALTVTVLGLCAVNLSEALAQVLDGRSTWAYWAQTGVFAGYLLWLAFLYRRNPPQT